MKLHVTALHVAVSNIAYWRERTNSYTVLRDCNYASMSVICVTVRIVYPLLVMLFVRDRTNSARPFIRDRTNSARLLIRDRTNSHCE